MKRLLAQPHRLLSDTPNRAKLEPTALFLHAPNEADERNVAVFDDVILSGASHFRTQLSLPAGAPAVRFGLTLRGADGDVLETFCDFQGGARRWGVDLSGFVGSFSLSLWTARAPQAETNAKAWSRFLQPVIIEESEWDRLEGLGQFELADDDAEYPQPDPWNYEGSPDDQMRRARLLAAIPVRPYARTLEIGCGDGFLTFGLPGETVTGIDRSARAVEFACEKAAMRADHHRYAFRQGDLLETINDGLGQFDLIVIAGVMYPHYVGRSWNMLDERLRALASKNAVVVACHIHAWTSHRLRLPKVRTLQYRYRQYTHVLEVFSA